MDRPKRILILYASAGHGHEKAARALEAEYRSRVPEAAVDCRDILKLTPPVFGGGYRGVYLFLIQHLPKVWGFFFYLADAPWVFIPLKPVRRLVNRLMAGRLERLVIDEKPDLIFSTHFMSTEVVGWLKRKKKTSAALVTVVTDFFPHYFWINGDVDEYVVALPETREALISRGIEASRIHVFGIPIEKKFSVRIPKAQVRARLSLDGLRFTVLFTSGGAAVGAVSRIAERLLALDPPLQLLVVCGTNHALRDSLSAETARYPFLKVFGFVDNMDELMSAADLVIGKGGGLTLSESLAKEIPMAIFRPVPGQETWNAACLRAHHAAFVTTALDELVAKVAGFVRDPESLEAYRTAGRDVAKPFAARDIVEWSLEKYGK